MENYKLQALAQLLLLGWLFLVSEHSLADVVTKHTWTDELREFDEAATAARKYALENNGVGLLIHVGTEAASRNVEHDIGKRIVDWLKSPNRIPQKFIAENCPDVATANVAGVQSEYFLSYNDVHTTRLSRCKRC